jgi:hypothetical protein
LRQQTICLMGELNMKHAYVPRATTYGLNPGDELNDLRMSDEVRPLYEHVRKFIRETVDPMSAEFYRLGESKPDRWSFTPGQIEVLESAKRPVSAVADDFEVRDVTAVDVVEDRSLSMTLLYDAGHNLDERILAEQFSD